MNEKLMGCSKLERMERERLKCFDEEEDVLACSTKKFKDSHMPIGDLGGNEHDVRNRVKSYKDKLVGAIAGAFEKAFGFESFMQEDIVSDDEEE